MPLIDLVIAIIIVGVLLWVVNSFIPMDVQVKKVLNIVVIVCLVLYVLSAFGIFGHLSSYQVPRLR